MKFAFWYLLSVAAGVGLLFSVARESSRSFGQGKGEDISSGSTAVIPSPSFDGAQTNWALISGMAMAILAFSLWKVFRESNGISKGEWLRIGLATVAMVGAPIIFVVALGWKN